ncbi:TatD family hydrolase [Wukongibacter baidiensis]|uniref:TatD family hydrolase n=1 Tax=Wukongibacter baidiensis TaxID=1723361 RepID=UPI003D7F900E
MLFDSHTHLTSRRFDRDRDKVIQRMEKNDVTYALLPGSSFENSVEAAELANKYDMFYASVGVHPCNTKDLDGMTLQLLKALARKPKVVAIGEIGLDYYHDDSPIDIQRKWFIEQIRLAKDLKLPMIIHDREANDDVFNILKQENAFETGVLVHCYSGNASLARKYVRLGAYLSIAGPVTYNGARKLHEVVKAVPLDNIMIETDAPSLTPQPLRGKRNEPSYVKYVAERIAELKEISYEEVAEKTMENAKKFFRIRDRRMLY